MSPSDKKRFLIRCSPTQSKNISRATARTAPRSFVQNAKKKSRPALKSGRMSGFMIRRKRNMTALRNRWKNGSWQLKTSRATRMLRLPPFRKEVRSGINPLNETSAAKFVHNGLGFILYSIKFFRQAGGVTMPDSVPVRVFPDETKCFFPVEILDRKMG